MLRTLELETLKNLKSSKAFKYTESLQIRLQRLSFVFCTKHGFQSMPSEPKILSLYLTYLSKTSKFSTLKTKISLNKRHS